MYILPCGIKLKCLIKGDFSEVFSFTIESLLLCSYLFQLTPVSIHTSCCCGGSDSALPQMGLLHDGCDLSGIRRCAALLQAAAAVNGGITS